jgi:hypothetical protein
MDECYEVKELPWTHPIEFYVYTGDSWKGEWYGPLSQKNVERCFKEQDIFTGLTSPGMNSQRMYNFVKAYKDDDGNVLTWRYKHCSNKSALLIRPVQPSPEIHVVMKKQWFGGTKVTAVAENDRSILEWLVTEDVRIGEFKTAVMKRCVEEGLCTRQSVLTMYCDNALVSSNMILRADYDGQKRRRLPKIIYATDGSLTNDPIAPQSRSGSTAPQGLYVCGPCSRWCDHGGEPKHPVSISDAKRERLLQFKTAPGLSSGIPHKDEDRAAWMVMQTCPSCPQKPTRGNMCDDLCPHCLVAGCIDDDDELAVNCYEDWECTLCNRAVDPESDEFVVSWDSVCGLIGKLAASVLKSYSHRRCYEVMVIDQAHNTATGRYWCFPWSLLDLRSNCGWWYGRYWTCVATAAGLRHGRRSAID